MLQCLCFGTWLNVSFPGAINFLVSTSWKICGTYSLYALTIWEKNLWTNFYCLGLLDYDVNSKIIIFRNKRTALVLNQRSPQKMSCWLVKKQISIRWCKQPTPRLQSLTRVYWSSLQTQNSAKSSAKSHPATYQKTKVSIAICSPKNKNYPGAGSLRLEHP